MKQYNGYLYGNYDSRGGTMFVIAPSYDEANKKYAERLEHEIDIAYDHYMCPATLHSQNELNDYTDLGETVWVSDDIGEEDEFLDLTDNHIDLYHNPEDTSGLVLPRWDDDAYVFVVIV